MNSFGYFPFIGAFSVENIRVPWLTAHDMKRSTVVYGVTLKTNIADFVCKLIYKTPVYKL